MTNTDKTSNAALAEARVKALEEATAEGQRIARQWRDEAEGTHSSHHSDLLRTWSDAAQRVADAIAALARPGGANGDGRA